MRYGVVFPHDEVGPDPDDVRRFVSALEVGGFDYLCAPDHVLGADAKTRPDWNHAYDTDTLLHEVFVLFGFLAGFTKLELVTAILVLPQRQTAVVAKQAAELDVLTGGNVRLGVAIGWNHVEYAALGEDFSTRAARMEEQCEVLRLLWTNRVVTFNGRFHDMDRVGILPLPMQRPIPLWLGGGGKRTGSPASRRFDRVLDRIGRVGDGWITGLADVEHLAYSFGEVRLAAERAGRDPDAIGLQTSLKVTNSSELARLNQKLDGVENAGATHVTIETRNVGLSLAEHIELIGSVGDLLQTRK